MGRETSVEGPADEVKHQIMCQTWWTQCYYGMEQALCCLLMMDQDEF